VLAIRHKLSTSYRALRRRLRNVENHAPTSILPCVQRFWRLATKDILSALNRVAGRLPPPSTSGTFSRNTGKDRQLLSVEQHIA
jgi:hypothetical protein